MVAPSRPERVVHWPDWSKFRPSPVQRAIYDDNSREVAVCAGRGFGKDLVLLYRALRLGFQLYADRKARPRWFRPGPVCSIAIIAPQSSNYEGAWEKVRDALPTIPGSGVGGQPNVLIFEKSRKIEIFGKNQIVIRFLSSWGKNNVRSHGYDIMVITEAAFLPESVFNSVLKPLCQRPGYAGMIALNSTPYNNWFDLACDQAQKHIGSYGDWSVHFAKTSDNPYCEDWLIKLMEKCKVSNPWRYRQEYCAELFIDVPLDDVETDPKTRAFAPDLIEPCYVIEEQKVTGPFLIGLDLAWQGPDDLAVVVLDEPTGFVCSIEVHPKTGEQEIRRIFERLNEQWSHPLIVYDATHWLGSKIQGFLRGCRVHPYKVRGEEGDRSKAGLVKHFISHALAQSIKLPHPDRYPFPDVTQRMHHQRLRQEIKGYRATVEVRPDGRRFIRYAKGPLTSDDILDALHFATIFLPVRELNAPATSVRGLVAV